MGKPRDLFKKIGNTRSKFHAKRDTIKERNGTALTEAEAIKKRWQEYTGELCTKDLHDPFKHDDVITHLEAEHTGMRSQEGFRKHKYKQSS